MIGLKRHTVKVVDHDPEWFGLGVEACQAVRKACHELLADVQHVGSTAVPDLPAKPTLDIAAAVVTFDSMPQLVHRLAGIGYRYKGDHRDAGGHYFVMDSSKDVRTNHLHLVEHDGNQWRDYLRFRDLLRHQPAIRRRYAELKRGLVSTCGNDRGLYTSSKADFMRQVLDRDLISAGDPTHEK
jgi:GrpB-like predicted nucleotidyltransferase (UPF0157 family)